MKDPIKIGQTYEHYKGNSYRVLGFVRHSETLEEMVVYQALYDCPKFGSEQIWVRPAAMFVEEVTINGAIMPRFKAKPLQSCP